MQESRTVPVLTNPRRERFAQLLASGKTATDAYEMAGYKRHDGNGPAAAKKPEVAARVAEISGIAAERAAVTVESLIAEAEEARQGAIKEGQWSAAIAAIREKGVLSGKRVERSERGTPGEFNWLENLSTEQLKAYVAGEIDFDSEGKPISATNEGTSAPRRRPVLRGPSIN
jgi:phage terminase small subunit